MSFHFSAQLYFFSLCQAWLIVDFHQITTIIHRPAPPSRQPVKASPADRKEKSRFTHFRKSCLSPWHGHGCQIPVSLSREPSTDTAEGEHLVCCMKASLKRMWFWRKQSKAWIFFFFLHGNSLSFTSLLALFFYLRYHFFSTTVYTSLLCASSVKYNLRLLLYALILPVSPSFVPLRDPSETSLVFFAEPINLQPCSWETRVFSGSQPHMEMVVRIIFRKLTMFWNQNIFTYFPRSISDH